MARHKDAQWNLPEGNPDSRGCNTHSWDSIHTALLMDIRDELKRMNAVLYCSNTQRIPIYLHRIAGNTTKPRGKNDRHLHPP